MQHLSTIDAIVFHEKISNRSKSRHVPVHTMGHHDYPHCISHLPSCGLQLESEAHRGPLWESKLRFRIRWGRRHFDRYMHPYPTDSDDMEPPDA